jgi:hypothetical protein
MPIAARSQMYYIGIDPGAKGGITVLDGNGKVYRSIPIPEGEVNLWQSFDSTRFDMVTAVIEQVSGYAGERQPGSAMFNFGRGYGALLMGLVAAKIPFVTVVPRTWQKALGITPKKKGMTKPQWKRQLKSIAQQRFPQVEVTLWMADSLLIADYCRRRELGLL